MKLRFKRGSLFELDNGEYCIILRRIKNKKCNVIVLNENGDVIRLDTMDIAKLKSPTKIPINIDTLY
jgi:hypothetical protein